MNASLESLIDSAEEILINFEQYLTFYCGLIYHTGTSQAFESMLLGSRLLFLS
jgi:hypothetical protein